MKLYSVEGNHDGLVLVTHKLNEAIKKAYDYAELELTEENAKQSKKTLRTLNMLSLGQGTNNIAFIFVWES